MSFYCSVYYFIILLSVFMNCFLVLFSFFVLIATAVVFVFVAAVVVAYYHRHSFLTNPLPEIGSKEKERNKQTVQIFFCRYVVCTYISILVFIYFFLFSLLRCKRKNLVSSITRLESNKYNNINNKLSLKFITILKSRFYL